MEPGALLGRFKIVEPIGTGGMGVVYKATDPELGRTVAIKVLHDEAGSEGNEARQRLLREAKAMAQLAHPNVVPVHEIGSGEPSFIVMEHVAGGTVRQWLAEPRPTAEILNVFEQAGRGLAAAHDAGLVHRDFKPENCLRGTDGRVRVVDFGLVSNRAERTLELPADTSLDVALTRTGIAMGTPAYMAPEQHRGEPSDARSDQFSFAVTLYEALYGERPFAGTTYREMVRNVYAGKVRDASSDNVSASLRAVLLRALSVDPAGRYASIAELLAELKPVEAAITPVGTPVVPVAQLAQAAPVVAPAVAPIVRRRLPIAIAAVAIVVAVGAGIVAASSSSTTSSTPAASQPSTSPPPTTSVQTTSPSTSRSSAPSVSASQTSPSPSVSASPTSASPTSTRSTSIPSQFPTSSQPPSPSMSTATRPAVNDPKARDSGKPNDPKATRLPPVVRSGSAAPPMGSAAPPVDVDDAADRRRRQLELKE